MNQDIKYGVGLMSGTSLDGVDAALVKITGYGENTQIDLLGFSNEDMDKGLKKEIKECCSPTTSSIDKICSLNFKLGYVFAGAVKSVCAKAGFDLKKLDFIGSHGQTIYHIPKDKNHLNKSTFQIGEPSVIAYETGSLVVSNFRTMDMAAGGEGAPLVPYTEYLLYKCNKNRVLQNIGGIGNCTIIPADCSIDQIYAFDTGPGNMIIDEVVQRLKGKKYDYGGKFAAQGKVNEIVLNELLNIEYITKNPPKTTGREQFGKEFVDNFLKKYNNLKSEDIIATVTMFTAKSIEINYRKFILNKYDIDEVIIGGGGSYNSTLIDMLKGLLKECRVLTGEDLGMNSDAKEAIAFAVLANETLKGNCSNIIEATGAKERVVLGNITPKIRR